MHQQQLYGNTYVAWSCSARDDRLGKLVVREEVCGARSTPMAGSIMGDRHALSAPPLIQLHGACTVTCSLKRFSGSLTLE